MQDKYEKENFNRQTDHQNFEKQIYLKKLKKMW